MDSESIYKASKYLAQHDPILGKIIEENNYTFSLTFRSEYAEYVCAIIGQRVTLKAARASRQRLYTLLSYDFSREDLEPYLTNLEPLLKIDVNRATAIRNYHENSGNVTPKGVGPWTRAIVEMKTNPNVLPPNDIALLNAVKKLYGMERRPTQAQLVEIAKKWEPYRSVACFWLWKI